MPMKSKAMWRAMGAKMDEGKISKATFDEFAHSTPGGYDALPERVAQPKKTKVKKSPAGPKPGRANKKIVPTAHSLKLSKTPAVKKVKTT